jgi:hypothetical protein
VNETIHLDIKHPPLWLISFSSQAPGSAGRVMLAAQLAAQANRGTPPLFEGVEFHEALT